MILDMTYQIYGATVRIKRPIRTCEETSLIGYIVIHNGVINFICSICIIIAHIKSGICLLVPSGHHFELIYTISNPPLLRLGTGSGAVPPPCTNVMYLKFFLIFYILNHYGSIIE